MLFDPGQKSVAGQLESAFPLWLNDRSIVALGGHGALTWTGNVDTYIILFSLCCVKPNYDRMNLSDRIAGVILRPKKEPPPVKAVASEMISY